MNELKTSQGTGSAKQRQSVVLWRMFRDRGVFVVQGGRIFWELNRLSLSSKALVWEQ